MSNFSQFALGKPLVEQLSKLGYVELTPVQEKVIPRALRGESLVVKSATGTGKTHAFLVPLINKLDLNNKNPQAIILSPTRELANQTYKFARELLPIYPELRIAFLAGGEEKSRNKDKLALNPQLIIATPGRLKDLGFEDTVTSLTSVKTIVLDEADMLLDSGFFTIIDEILGALLSPQIMVFSATISQNLTNLIAKYLKTKEIIDLSGDSPTANLVKHYAIDTRHQAKEQVLLDFIKWRNPYFLLIFASTRKDVQKIYEFLLNAGYQVGTIHADLSSRARKNMMKRVRNDEFPIVVASDMAARGIDLDHVSDVLNLDLPNNLEYYFHRAGRTGRYDEQGSAWTLYNKDSAKVIAKLVNQGVDFSYYVYQNDEFKETSSARVTKKEKVITAEQKELQTKVKRTIGYTQGNKVKPGYKKKRQQAVAKVAKQHAKEQRRKQVRRKK